MPTNSPLHSPARCAEQLLKLEPEAQADLVLALGVPCARLILRTLNALHTSSGWQWDDQRAAHYESARYLLMLWAGLYDHALHLVSASSEDAAVQRLKQARIAACMKTR